GRGYRASGPESRRRVRSRGRRSQYASDTAPVLEGTGETEFTTKKRNERRRNEEDAFFSKTIYIFPSVTSEDKQHGSNWRQRVGMDLPREYRRVRPAGPDGQADGIRPH